MKTLSVLTLLLLSSIAAASPATTPRIVEAADAFLATLDPARKATVQFAQGDTAQKQRWSNLPGGAFDLSLANPPYFAQHSISRMFIERSHALLRRGGRMYFVTRQFEQVEVMVEEYFPEPLVMERRGYAVLVCTKR